MDAIHWHNGTWHKTARPLLGLGDNSFWMGNSVFDGARTYEGVTPDLDRHCARALRSAAIMLLRPPLDVETLIDICLEGVAMFEPEAELYIRPMFYARGGFIIPDPDTTECAVVIHRAPMPSQEGFSACMAPFRRPDPDMAPTQAKASCLYPLTQHALSYAHAHGFDNALLCNSHGDVAEFSTCNIMIASGSTLVTPEADGTFLAGITRMRVIALMRDAGMDVVERRLRPEDVFEADEVFSTGNYGKVLPVRRLGDRDLGHGPMARRAAALYRAYAHDTAREAVTC